MSFKTIRNEFIKELREKYTIFFNKKSTTNTNVINLLDTLVEYYMIRYALIFKYFNLYGNSIVRKLEESEQYYVSIFFGDKENEGLETLIKSNALFWSLYPFFIKKNEFPSFQLKKYSDAYNRFNRNKTDMYLRIESFNTNYCIYTLINEIKDRKELDKLFAYFKIVTDKKLGKDFRSRVENDRNESYQLYKRLVQNKNIITVYRGFDIDDKEDIRLGRKLKGNSNSHIQLSGKGISYTTDKKIAEEFGLNRWKLLSTNVDWKSRINWSDLLLENENVDVDNFLVTCGRKPVIASYEIKVTDIVYPFLTFEKEIVSFPEKVKLLNYKFLKYS